MTRAHARTWFPIVLGVVALLAFLGYGSVRGSNPGPRLTDRVQTRLGSGFVTRVADGDTLTLHDGRRIRLVQIDAPEVTERECYADEARRALERLAPIGTQVSPRLDPDLDIRDTNGRLLAYVFRDGVNANLRLVETGAAAPYFYRRERGRYADELMASARRAQAAGRGLWGACPGTRLDPNRRVDTGP